VNQLAQLAKNGNHQCIETWKTQTINGLLELWQICACWRYDLQWGMAKILAGERHQRTATSSWMCDAAERHTHQMHL